MVRKKGVGLLAGVAIFIILCIILFRDSFLQRTMNRAGSSIVGSKVEFHRVHYSILKNTVSWKNLRVANPYDPGNYLFETGPSSLILQLEPLLSKRFIFQSARFDSLRFNTVRKSSGNPYNFHIPSDIAPFYDTIAEQLNNKLRELSMYGSESLAYLNIDSIMKVANVNTHLKIDSLKNLVEKKSKLWSELVASIPDQKTISKIQKRVDSIDVNQIKTIPQVAEAIGFLNNISKEVDSIKSVIDSVNRVVSSEIAVARNYIIVVKTWISNNYAMLLLIAHIPEITSENASEVLFGPSVIRKILSAIPYLGIARYYGEKARSVLQAKKINLPRRMGQNIPFPEKHGWPQFWIKDLALTGTIFQNVNAQGYARNIVTQQKLIGQPTSIELIGTQSGKISLSLNALFNYLETISLERYTMETKNVSLDNIDLHSQLIPIKIRKGLGDISGSIQSQGTSFAAQAGFIGTNLLFDMTSQDTQKIDPQILIMRDSLIHSVNQLSISAFTKLIGRALSLDISSNIANQIADLMKKFPIKALEAARAKLRDRLDRQLGPKQKELQGVIDQQTAGIQDSLSLRNELLKKIEQVVKNKSKELKGLPFGLH